jgi:hypothetical protein
MSSLKEEELPWRAEMIRVTQTRRLWLIWIKPLHLSLKINQWTKTQHYLKPKMRSRTRMKL